jgi:hypothetical protein
MISLFARNVREPACKEQYREAHRNPRAPPRPYSAAPHLFDTPRGSHPDSDVSNHFSFQTRPVGSCLEACEYLPVCFPFHFGAYGTEPQNLLFAIRAFANVAANVPSRQPHQIAFRIER